MKTKVLLLNIILFVFVCVCSALIACIRGSINPQIIGYGYIHNDKFGTYVEVDSQQYVINDFISVVLPSFPVRYEPDYVAKKYNIATVFKSDIGGYQAVIGIEDDESIIENAYKNPLLECVSYDRPYLILIFFISLNIIGVLIAVLKK